MLLNLYADLNVFIGQQKSLISITDLAIMKLQGNSIINFILQGKQSNNNI